ncbi:hypothetical protein A3K29_03830 [Candidatus Collierbacteria bacterium RIFOXYB2_FULL_46_14]|nr:MAG: hypothetical protein A3K29_03830 [Candidatus Collierbacteria bacterium RIFOXYB2_FULL_46_14]OGD76285.1 MAG: hypothetical protein A3K43_03830 [Candidatus Collierbacteria bacterium RIFOXYA2_FULL_46_20]OGD77621.1 MAG: hypothetical protein A3K39_03830 [Candidatus Collierbacteria bacterium RIFOXYC2_FULL_43_15]OGD80911.1 MAG: hypothetical protein A2320_04325 [Pseudomonadales bacterium GWC2_63_15]OGD82343.1 MAG: hypothetical protein A3K36_03830 [Candidatus Collierbacteria bacterium RIFOXYD2_FUL
MGNIFWFMNMVQERKIRGRYMFVDRDGTRYPAGHLDQLKEEIGYMASLSADPYVSGYISDKWPFLPNSFLQWYDQVFFHDTSQLDLSQKDGELRVVVEGPIHTATHWEVPFLRINSTILSRELGHNSPSGWRLQAEENAKFFWENNIAYSEGGGRRPLSAEHHFEALKVYSEYKKREGHGGLLGTSWVKYASDLNLMIMGTMAHEYPELMAALYGYPLANKMAMQTWIDHYGKRVGYFLPDTFTTEVALRDFDHYFANTFEGTRQDSRSPFWYADLMVAHYRRLGIDMRQKSIVFSNSLKTRKEISAVNEYRPGEYRRGVLLGGYITNNVGFKPYNTVLKLVAVKVADGPWQDVVKLSDDPAKSIGKIEEIARCRQILGIQD